MIQEEFGNRIKEIRNSLLISQAELSKLTGIERAQLSKIEKGKVNVTLETIEKVSNAFRMPIKDLMTIDSVTKLKPFVKWAGGKTQIILKLQSLLPKHFNNYFEPFVGGGALLFSLAPKVAFINDFNAELVSVYKCFQDAKNFKLFVTKMEEFEEKHNEEFYYEVRANNTEPSKVLNSTYYQAARMVYLNKACFNGLYRVNSKGIFNVPSGKKEKVCLFDRNNIESIRNYFMNNNITVTNEDFEKAVENAAEGDFVYFDPPYDTFEDKNNFTSYSKEKFGKEEQARLAEVFQKLASKKVFVMLSNHDTKFINELYQDFNIHHIEAKRMINSNANGRGNVEEVIITNY